MNENNPSVSVIVPVYNTEKYLAEAIESVLNQSYTDFELILINDRSADGSKEICERYAQKDNRVILLENNTQNHGPGPTRNIGLDNAKGEFIYFMDADDWIENNLLESAVCRMQETNADIVQFGFVREQGDKEQTVCCRIGKDGMTREEIKNDFLNFTKAHRMSLWLQFFKRETVKSVRFENIINGEDVCYTLDALCGADKIAYISKPLYHYRVVAGSASHHWIENTIECREAIWNHKSNLFKSVSGGIDNAVYAEMAYDNYIWSIYLLSSNLCPLSYKEKKRQLSVLAEKTEFEKYRKYCCFKRQKGMNKLKYILVKFRLENVLLLFGPLFLMMVRGE